MDYSRPLEAIIPGTSGRVLGVLARTETELTITQVAKLAQASRDRTSVAIGRLVSLGIVSRREIAGAVLVRLERGSAAAGPLLALLDLRSTVVDQLVAAAEMIDPQPASLALFGSFARGTAGVGSDLDVLAIRPDGVGLDDERWLDTFGEWQNIAQRVAGNPVHVLDVSVHELPDLVEKRPMWQKIVREAMRLTGEEPERLAAEPHTRATIVSQAVPRSGPGTTRALAAHRSPRARR
ncbi:MAG TPA: nucleotidyltransferase domain-containing protein [Acidimicrobiales bacterium]|nr:nucleotidyltransferase domain-containing protein [Acidimicrobiales bacterium]